MDLSLQNGGSVRLFKTAPFLRHVIAGLGSDTRSSDDVDIDLDTSIFMVSESGRVRAACDVVFYGKLCSTCGSVEHIDGSCPGAGYGHRHSYDLALIMTIVQVPAKTSQRVLVVTVHKAQVREQNLGMMPDVFIRFVNFENKVDITRFDLSEDYSTKTSMVFGETYCHNANVNSRPSGKALRVVSVHLLFSMV